VDVTTAVEALTQLARRRFSLIVLDLALTGRGGLEFISDVHSAYQRVPILVFSSLPEELYAYRALRAGASGYLHRSAQIEEILRAIREVIAGHKYLGQAASAAIALELSSGCPPTHTALSNREFEVLRAIASGSTLTETAHKMSLSIKTIATHKRRLMRKLGVFNNAALIRFAVQAGIVAAETPVANSAGGAN
jgi:DNA-binding NarL/FixJ family response regulator